MRYVTHQQQAGAREAHWPSLPQRLTCSRRKPYIPTAVQSQHSDATHPEATFAHNLQQPERLFCSNQSTYPAKQSASVIHDSNSAAEDVEQQQVGGLYVLPSGGTQR